MSVNKHILNSSSFSHILNTNHIEVMKLKLQYFGHLLRRADSFEKTLTLGRIESRRRRG